MPDHTSRRKDAHLDLCATGPVEPGENEPLFRCVHLVHQALPELSLSELDPSTTFLGKRLSLPLMITGMTGGTERGRAVNQDLAEVAQQLGIGFGLGSQRAMLDDPKAATSFSVRQRAPQVALLGNIGLWQARQLGADGVRRLMDAVGADGMAVHLNAGQEVIQPEGDRDFSGGLRTLEKLASALGERLVVKETGCGIGPETAQRLAEVGVKNLDVSGLGGTSWVQVEALRSEDSARQLGESFSGWGIPTAAAVAAISRKLGAKVRIIASGGIRDGLQAAKAIALGASLAGTALPVLRAYHAGGQKAAAEVLERMAQGLRTAMALTGSRTVDGLSARPPVVTGELREWIDGLLAPAGRAQ